MTSGTRDTDAEPDAITLGGRYRLDGRIAIGGMGEVWAARDLLLDRDVAVKLLKAEYLQDPGFLARFRAEARHSAGLSHPGIATVYDYAEVNEAPYLVMELVRGEPLSALLARSGALPVGQAVEIAAQTAHALGAAHAAGVVHRDVKPGNILVCPDGSVKVTDFGIARAADAAPLTQTGTVIGTASYLSPEQAEGRPTAPASDLYSLGVVTYEMVAGYRPFAADNPVAAALAHIREQPQPLPAAVPAQVQSFVLKALQKRPEDRYADAAAFAAAAEHAAAVAAGVLPPGPLLPAETSVVEQAGRPGEGTRVLRLGAKRRRPAGWLLAAAVVIALLVAVAADAMFDDTQRAADALPGQASPTAAPTASASPIASTPPARVAVPTTAVGLPYEQAAAAVRAVGLIPQRRDAANPANAGFVFGTDPGPGTSLTRGARVTLVTSTGPAPVQQAPVSTPPGDKDGGDDQPGKGKKKRDRDAGDD